MDTSGTGCDECAGITQQMNKAAQEYDRSAETDARVILRRHVRAVHERELPLPSCPAPCLLPCAACQQEGWQ